jgi:ornithine cyclodeaminase
MATAPFIGGAWLRPGQHLDLVGAFRPDMREVDDDALRRARIFLDSFDTTLGHIGEIQDPLDRGVITRADILGDYYDLDSGTYCRRSDNDITLFKNGGGAHLDLITGRYILDAWRAAQ